MDILERALWGNTLLTWLQAVAVAVLVFLALHVVKRVVARWVRVWVQRTKTDLDDLVVDLFRRTWYLFLASVAVYAGSFVLSLPQVEPGLRIVMMMLFLAQVAIWSTGVIDYLASRYGKDAASAAAVSVLSFLGKVVLWAVAVLLALDNLPGVQVDTLIASLGIGGVAVALAVQNVLGDLFASLSIVLDEPFVIGDSISVGEYVGTVEHIGLKSTRVRSLTGEQLVFANSDLLDSRIRNYGRMDERRVSFSLGVANETPHEKLVEIPGIVQGIVEAQPQARFGRAHLKGFGDFALDFEVVYYLSTSDYTVFMDTQQAINLEILRRFGEERIELPYPTQAIRLAR
jgi:small-conductance mechanosensitive channel